MSLSKAEALRLARLCISQDVSSVNLSSIARLWGGMGHIYRIETMNDCNDPSLFVVKYVHPQRVSATPSFGDQRKLDSYTVETAFYECYSEDLRKQGVGLARCLHVEEERRKTVICLSLLQNAPDRNFHESVIEWLAHFHATTWQKECPRLQPIGTYWHLDTRPQEWKAMNGEGWEGRLKVAAPALDRWLKETPIQSWVHGDAKDENVMWDGNKVAMCDFQYVGRGCPLKDLCYFLCSCGRADDTRLVDLYYERLCTKLKMPLCRRQFDVALDLSFCDYLRFMCGWCQWGSDITSRVKNVLDRLDGGVNLGSEKAYANAIYNVLGK